MTTTLKIYKTHKDIRLPLHQTEQSACFDIAAQYAGKRTYSGYNTRNKEFNRPIEKGIYLGPNERVLVPTGLIFDIPKGYSVRIHPRSGLSLKNGLILANCQGIIDSDYVEEVYIIMTNISDNAFTIKDGDRIAQAELKPVQEYTIEELKERPINKTIRFGGFGSTGMITIR